MNWRSIVLDPPPDGQRILFYSIDLDHIYVGILLDGRWFDEAEHDTVAMSAREVGQITHWMPLPEKPRR